MPRFCLAACGLALILFAPACQDDTHPALRMDVSGPSAADVNAPFPLRILVTNVGTAAAEDVRVEDVLPPGLGPVKSTVQPEIHKGGLAWSLGTLAVGEKKEILVMLRAPQAGEYTQLVTAQARGAKTVQVRAAVVVGRANLAVAIAVPDRARAGEEIEASLSVRNTAAVPAQGVRLVCHLPTGVQTADGEQTIDVEIGTLGSSQTQLFPVPLVAAAAGEYPLSATATGAGGLVALARATLRVAPRP